MWCLAELGLEATRLDYGHVYGGLDTPEFKALTPHGLVPVLKDDDTVIWESAAIVRYLCARYGQSTLWPENPLERAGIDMWAEWGKNSFAREFTAPVFWPLVRTRPADRDQAALAKAISTIGIRAQVLEERLGDAEWISGAAFGMADLMVGHILYRYMTVPFEKPSLPMLDTYYQRLTERAAYRSHVMVSYEPLRVS